MFRVNTRKRNFSQTMASRDRIPRISFAKSSVFGERFHRIRGKKIKQKNRLRFQTKTDNRDEQIPFKKDTCM